MRIKTYNARIEKLQNDLNITKIEAQILQLFLSKKGIHENKTNTYFQIKLFCDYHLIDFTMLNNLYLKWLNFKAKELNKNVLHGLIIKPNENNGHLYINQVDFIDNLEVFYNLIKCQTIDIQERKINGKTYDFIIDDEYLLKENKLKHLSAIERGQTEMIYNRFMILGKADENGQETSLNEKDILNILKSRIIVNIGTDEKPKEKTILIYTY